MKLTKKELEILKKLEGTRELTLGSDFKKPVKRLERLSLIKVIELMGGVLMVSKPN